MEIITREAAKIQNNIRYYTGEACEHGHDVFRYTSNGICSTCANINSKEWRKRQPTDRWHTTNRLRRAKIRAKKVHVPFDLTMETMPTVPAICPILGIPLINSYGQVRPGPTPNSPSLDRIIPELGYVPNNVRIISHRANRLKDNATANEMRLILTDLEAIEATHPNKSRAGVRSFS